MPIQFYSFMKLVFQNYRNRVMKIQLRISTCFIRFIIFQFTC